MIVLRRKFTGTLRTGDGGNLHPDCRRENALYSYITTHQNLGFTLEIGTRCRFSFSSSQLALQYP